MQLHCTQAGETEKLENKPNKRRLCWVLSASGVHGFRQIHTQQLIYTANLGPKPPSREGPGLFATGNTDVLFG